MSVQIIRGNALDLPIADSSVDLIVTSPPYFNLRAYQDGGKTYEGQVGNEPTPVEFIDSLVDATREMVRVLKPSGSLWINLGDSYSGGQRLDNESTAWVPQKSLIGIPWRYAIRCIDELGLILRAEVIWSKPNGLPESVTDRVRRSHETWFHFTLNPSYYSAVDEVREERTWGRTINPEWAVKRAEWREGSGGRHTFSSLNPLGKLPGSVWTIATEPLRVPEELGVDHFAAFPTEWPRRIITGWSPRGVCVECGEGRRPVVEREYHGVRRDKPKDEAFHGAVRNVQFATGKKSSGDAQIDARYAVTGYACACPEPTAPTTPGVVLDPFGGTGTTALVADALGRHGISVDMSADYCRLAEWRTTDPKQRAKAAQKPYTPPTEQIDGQVSLLDLIKEESA